MTQQFASQVYIQKKYSHKQQKTCTRMFRAIIHNSLKLEAILILPAVEQISEYDKFVQW